MNYYKFNIGDYAAATRHLTMLEHGAYRLLLDVYYTSEAPMPADIKAAARKAGARSKEEVAAVETILSEFFTLTDRGWIQQRCDAEIEAYHTKAKTNQVVGKKGGRPRKATHTDTVSLDSGNPEKTQTVSGTNPQETLTTNQEPITNNPHTPKGADTDLDEDEPEAPPVEPTDPEAPPAEPKTEAKAAGAVTIQTWLDVCKAQGVMPVPEDDPVFAYAESVGIPDDMLALAWREFRIRYAEPGAKRYRDWRSVFRKAVRGNWLKLWFVTADGAYELTSVGKQAQMALAARRREVQA